MSDRLPQPAALSMPLTAAERASATAAHAPAMPYAAPGDALPAPRSTALRDVQVWMVEAICGARAADAATVVTPGPLLSAQQRLDVYRRGYRARLRECLADDYPSLAAALGEARFGELCDSYIAAHPSSTPSLNAFGQQMAAHCARSLAPEHGQFFAELARLEWALVEMVHAAIPAPLDLTVLQTLSQQAWNDVRLGQSEAVRLLRFEYPTNAYYQAFRNDDVAGPVPVPGASATAVYRIGPTLWRMDLTPAMTRVLAALFAGTTIGEALQQIHVDERDAAALAEAERSVTQWFSAWVRAGFFSSVSVDPPAR